MDALHFKVDHLKLLWSEYRSANEGLGRDYSDHSEWAREKLQAVLSEFDKLIQEQILWKSSLLAEIEDLL
ncbi:33161_t:CDS:2, partial [Racocetra persica]